MFVIGLVDDAFKKNEVSAYNKELYVEYIGKLRRFTPTSTHLDLSKSGPS